MRVGKKTCQEFSILSTQKNEPPQSCSSERVLFVLTRPCCDRQATCKYSRRLHSLRRPQGNLSGLIPFHPPPFCCQIGKGQLDNYTTIIHRPPEHNSPAVFHFLGEPENATALYFMGAAIRQRPGLPNSPPMQRSNSRQECLLGAFCGFLCINRRK